LEEEYSDSLLAVVDHACHIVSVSHPSRYYRLSSETLFGARDYLVLNTRSKIYEICTETCHPYNKARILFRMFFRIHEYLFIHHIELYVMDAKIEPGFEIGSKNISVIVIEELGHEFLIK